MKLNPKRIAIIAILSLLAISALALLLWVKSTRYSALPINATIVDSASKQPLEGVIIVAHWQLEGGLEGGNNLGQVMVMETTTDKAGKFSFPAWGPKVIPFDQFTNARLKTMDPRLLLFKSGYKYLSLENQKTMDQYRTKAPYVRTSDWDGKTIEMSRFTGDEEKYSSELENLGSALEFGVLYPDYCEWKNIPKMVVALEQQQRQFLSEELKHTATAYDSLLANEANLSKWGCGSVKELLAKYFR